eukprot:9224774-Pyramimonas_sp.AAC.1
MQLHGRPESRVSRQASVRAASAGRADCQGGGPNIVKQQLNIKCECCGVPGRRRAGCSCVGGRSHQCRKTCGVKQNSGQQSTGYPKKESPTTSPRPPAQRRTVT